MVPGASRTAEGAHRPPYHLLVVLALLLCGTSPWPVVAQGLSSSSVRPFVIGTVPVVGRNGAVGGVVIDAQGVLQRGGVQAGAHLRRQWLAALDVSGQQSASASPLRRVSLRRLEAALVERRRQDLPPTWEMQFLAGLQRAQYVFAYPDGSDIVLAGPADAWTVNDRGDVVGRSSGQPVLHLEDLIVALRSARAAAQGSGISCSIDPTAAGLAKFRRLMEGRSLTMGSEAIRRLERALGPSEISVTGVEPDTRFARVMVAADVLMKRLAMNFEPARVEDLPSYLQLIQQDPALPADAMFRLWLAPHYQSILRDADGLAWELRGPGVAAQTAGSLLAADGQVVDDLPPDPLAEQWAAAFSERFESLAAAYPAFAELRNCIDLAVVAAAIERGGLPSPAARQQDPFLLWNPDVIQLARFPVPQRTPSQASFVQKGDVYVVSISGGVALDSWSVLEQARVSPSMQTAWRLAAPPRTAGWWWD